MAMTPQRFVVAPDKFKGSLSAVEVAASIADGIHEQLPTAQITCIPMADGGDGTLEAMYSAGFVDRTVDAAGPVGAMRTARYGWRESAGSKQAFVELATICGIALLDTSDRDPYVASSLGVGQAINHAANAGADEIVVALGGSASVDGGLGVLVGLGYRVSDSEGRPVEPNLRGLLRARHIDTHSAPKFTANVIVLADVTNPLCGPQGAANVFGPQKGLHDAELDYVDVALADWGQLLERSFGVAVADVAGTGAAGGIPAALIAALGARIVRGAEWIAEQRSLEQAIISGDVIITGEGAFDAQSLMGKAPGLVIDMARRHGKQIMVVAGSVDRRIAEKYALVAASTSEIAGSIARSFVNPGIWVTKATEQALHTLLHEPEIERNHS